MAQHFISEEQVMNELRVDSFQNLSQDKYAEFLSLIPKMDKDIAVAIINQLPEFTESATYIVAQLNELCDNILKSNDSSHKEAINAYKKILDMLGEMLKQDNITFEEKQKIIETMVDVANHISMKDTENKQFLLKILKGVGIALGVAALAVIGFMLCKRESDHDDSDIDPDFAPDPVDDFPDLNFNSMDDYSDINEVPLVDIA